MLSWLILKNYLLSRRSGALVRIIAWHCIIGIGMGVAALVIVLSVMNGFNISIRNRMLSVEPHLVIATAKLPGVKDLESMSSTISKLTATDQIDRFESQDIIIRSMEGMFGGAIAKGYEAATLNTLMKRVWRGNGEFPVLKPNEVVLGVDLARALGIFEGDEVILVPPETLLLPKGEIPHFRKFRVRSLINTQMPDVDSKVMFYNFGSSMPRSLSMINGYEVRLKDAYEADTVQKQLAAKGIKSQTWMERDISLFFALKMESYAMTLFLSLAVLITSFSIVTVMVLLLSQKRQDIGMLMALGLSYRKTRIVFLRVGLLLSSIGIVGGLILGTTVCLILDWYPMELLPDIYTDSTLPAKLTKGILYFVIGSSAVIAIVGSWLPVWRYVLRNPAESLRKPGGANI
ncbi:MAG: FtsX-like permease family protein [Bdellovibrionales bacterium]